MKDIQNSKRPTKPKKQTNKQPLQKECSNLKEIRCLISKLTKDYYGQDRIRMDKEISGIEQKHPK